MAYDLSDEQRQAARERLAARQARYAQPSSSSRVSDSNASLRGARVSTSTANTARRTTQPGPQVRPRVQPQNRAQSHPQNRVQTRNQSRPQVRERTQGQSRTQSQNGPQAQSPSQTQARPRVQEQTQDKTHSQTRRSINSSAVHSTPKRREIPAHAPVITGKQTGSSQLSFSGRNRDWKPLVLVIIAIILLIVVVFNITNCVSGCSNSSQQNATSTTNEQTTSEQSQTPSEADTNRANINKTALASLIGEDLADSLCKTAETNDEAAWIAAHYKDYAQYGERWQVKLLTLAAKEVEAIPYVRGYTNNFPATAANGGCDSFESGTVPHLYQWDTRWGWYPYSQSSIGMSGCGPAAVAMAYQGVTGKHDKSPYDIALDAINNGYVNNGTTESFYAWEAQNLGISCSTVSVSTSALRSALESGKVVICNVGPGDFTQVGHFIVLCSVDSSGMVTVNDPYSAVNSSKTWDISTIISQTKAMWAYSA